MKQLIYWLAGGKFKPVIYWLFGQKAGLTLTAIWNWLWGIPIESGGKIALESAKESLEIMEKSVAELTESVATVVGAYENVKSEYEVKKLEHQEAENQAILAHQKGHQEAARLAMTKAITLEKLLPKIKEKVDQAEKVVISAKQKLQQEKERLEVHKLEMQNLISLHAINQSLGKITDFDSSLNMGNAQDQFGEAGRAIQGKNLKINAQMELSENPHQQLQNTLNEITLDEEINRRLHRLNDPEIDKQS